MPVSPKMQSLIADISLVLVALFWGLGFVAMKDALDSYPTFWLLTLRFTGAFLLMALLFRRRIRGLRRKDYEAGGVVGVFLFLGFATQTLGLNYTTPGKQAFLTATYVVIVPFLVWALRKKYPGGLSFAASFLCLWGMGLLTLRQGFSMGLGDGLTLLCAFFFACQLVAVEHYASKTDPLVLAVLQIAVVALMSLPLALLFETWPGFLPGGAGLWSIGYTIVFCTIIAFSIQNIAQKFTPSAHTAILLSLESVFGALSGIYLLGEVFTPSMAAGCVLIFLAVLLTEAGPSLVRSFSSLLPSPSEKP